jgi:hypothetical protein
MLPSVGFSHRIDHEVSSVTSQIAFVACGQGRRDAANACCWTLAEKQP